MPRGSRAESKIAALHGTSRENRVAELQSAGLVSLPATGPRRGQNTKIRRDLVAAASSDAGLDVSSGRGLIARRNARQAVHPVGSRSRFHSDHRRLDTGVLDHLARLSPGAGAIVKHVPLLLAIASQPVGAGVFPTRDMRPSPSDWPPLAGMSDNCVEVQGTYRDPNAWRCDCEEFPGFPLGSKHGGTLEAAWSVFALQDEVVRALDRAEQRRVLTALFDSDGSVTVKYRIGRLTVTSRSFSRRDLSCGKDGLTITVADHAGVVLDNHPNKGRSITCSTLYRVGENLHVKVVGETSARTMWIVPESFSTVRWFRFAALPSSCD